MTRFSVKIKGFDAVSISIEEMGMRGGGIAGHGDQVRYLLYANSVGLYLHSLYVMHCEQATLLPADLYQ